MKSDRALAWRRGSCRFLLLSRFRARSRANSQDSSGARPRPLDPIPSPSIRPIVANMSLFGNTNQQQGSCLFGGNNNTQQQQQSGTSSLFGGQQQQQQNTGTSLFGAQNTQQQNQQQNHQPGQPLPYAPGQSGTFGAPITQPQPTNTNNPNNPNLPQNQNQNQNLPSNALSATTNTDLAASRLQANNFVSTRNEKTTFAQVQTLVRKWDPRSQDTPLQSYLYNAVSSSYAPFYYRNVDEEEEGWEEALRRKPAPVKGEGGGEEVSFVPVLVRGFRALGDRVEFQARTVNEMRARLHEMNNRYVVLALPLPQRLRELSTNKMPLPAASTP